MSIDYVWNGERFIEQNAPYNIGAYPNSAEDVVTQYLKLYGLDNWYPSNDIKRRLTELTGGKMLNPKLKEEHYSCSPAYGNFEFQTLQTDGNRITLSVRKLQFDMRKINNRWTIHSIK